MSDVINSAPTICALRGRTVCNETVWYIAATAENLTECHIVLKPRTFARRSIYARMIPLASTQRKEDEHRDCTVIATATYFGISYDEAHEKLAACGRRDRCGFQFAIAAATWGMSDLAPKLNLRKVSLKTALSSGRLPYRCIVSINNHVFCVIDGVVYDTIRSGSSTKIFCVYTEA
jgi:hypothetical protein